jgi:hypothetical protein
MQQATKRFKPFNDRVLTAETLSSQRSEYFSIKNSLLRALGASAVSGEAWPLTYESGWYENAAHRRLEGKVMERTVAWLGVALPEQVLFVLKSGFFLCASGVILYVALASSYPAVHDTLHNFRHALAVVPCH